MEQPPLKTHWYTDRGRRPANEDAVLVEALFGDRDLIAVADGMGGHAGGEVASGKALETVLGVLESSNDLAGAIREANQALQRASAANPEWRGMGTTLVALLRVGESYYIANVGDSRAYRVDADGIHQITEDHSFTAEAVSSGRLSEDEAERSPWRNALTRAVGTDADVEVDVFGPYALEPPHVILLCTDGLYRVMSDEELGSEVLSGRDRVDGARDLVASALRRGSSDNISVALVEFGDVDVLGSRRGAQDEKEAGLAALVAVEPLPAPEATADLEVGAGAGEAVVPSVEGVESVDASAQSAAEEEGDVGEVTGSTPELEAGDPEQMATVATPETVAAEPDAPKAPAGEDGPSTEVPADLTEERDGAENAPEPSAVIESVTPPDTDTEETEPPVEDARVTSSYRKAKPARPRRQRTRRPPHGPRKLPSWVKREAIPAAILVLGTLAIVYVLTSMFG